MRPTTIDKNERVKTVPAVDAQDETSLASATAATEGQEVVKQEDQANTKAVSLPPVVPQVEELAVSASFDVVIGRVQGVGWIMKSDDVLGLLGDYVHERLAAMKYSPSVKALAEQLRDTDGRSAPVYFTDDDGALTLFSGYKALAALADLVINDICVVTVPAIDCQALQSALASGLKPKFIASSAQATVAPPSLMGSGKLPA